MEKVTSVDDVVLAKAFFRQFESIRDSLASHIEAMQGGGDSYSLDILARNLQKLESQALLSGLSVIRPFFASFTTLLQGAALSEEGITSQSAALFAKLFSAFCRVIGDFISCLEEDGSDEPHTLKTDIDIGRLEELFNHIKKLRSDFPPEAAENRLAGEFRLDRGVVEQLVGESDELLRHLRMLLVGGERQGDITGADAVASLLGALQGNTNLALRSAAASPAPEHPISHIRSLLEHLLAAAQGEEAERRLLADEGADIFHFALETLARLFDEIAEHRDETVVDESELVEKLHDLRQAKAQAQGGEPANASSAPQPRAGSAPAAPATATSEEDGGQIRVKQAKLDKITNLVSELVVAKNSLSHVRALLDEGDAVRAILALESSEKLFSRVIHDMDKTVMGMRMQRVGELFQRFPRLVRDIARSGGKSIDLSLQGEETMMDNLILKAVADPLVHLVRNSCDHGIEPAGEREATGKPSTGRLQLSAGNEGGRIVIEVRDDGRGIDGDIIKELAVERGIIGRVEADAMDEASARGLIFAPGFSTASEITDISGRGVGMDVVRKNIEQVGGEIEIDSEVGRFTRIRLLLPLTLSISKGLKVVSSGQKFIIPLESVENMISTEGGRIRNHAEQMYLPLPNRTIALTQLAMLLGLEQRAGLQSDERLSVVLLDLKGRTLGVLVDGILGIEEIVTKPMPGALKRLPYFSGCCIMSDGSVVAVLNPAALARFGRQPISNGAQN